MPHFGRYSREQGRWIRVNAVDASETAPAEPRLVLERGIMEALPETATDKDPRQEKSVATV